MGNKISTAKKLNPRSSKAAMTAGSFSKASGPPIEDSPKPQPKLGLRDPAYLSALGLFSELPFHLADPDVQDTAGANTISIRLESLNKLREDDEYLYIRRQRREGTGTVIGTYGENWLILTARHVVWESCNADRQVAVDSTNRFEQYRRLYYSTKYDLALIYSPFDTNSLRVPQSFARISKRETLISNELLQGCGFPTCTQTAMLGLYRCRIMNSPGAHHKSASNQPLETHRLLDFSNLASGPGSSGSAIYDANSEVVGLLTGGVQSTEATPREYTIMETIHSIRDFLQDAIWKSLLEPSNEGKTISGLEGGGWDYNKPEVSPENVSARWELIVPGGPVLLAKY
jgi:hypothetical protein